VEKLKNVFVLAFPNNNRTYNLEKPKIGKRNTIGHAKGKTYL